MYSRHEASRLRQEFWTKFGQYMSPILSAEGEKINWINYKTGEKNIVFRMEADNKKASIAIIIDHKDPDVQQIIYEQFLNLRNTFEEMVPGSWEWKMHQYDDTGKIYSAIATAIDSNIYNTENWPELIRFFKQHIIGLDAFWAEAKYYFEALR